MSVYNHDTTAEEVAEDCKSQIANKTILVTGATPGGLGAAFTTTIAKHGPAGIILAMRSLAKAEETAKQIAAVNPSVRTWTVELDLGSQEQIKKAAEKINAIDARIDIIVNNAGIMAVPYSKSVDGIESQFATNHIGHFLLTNLLLPKILSQNTSVRVVNVTSNGFRFSPARVEDWNFDDGKTYNRWMAYGQSKTANMLFSRSLAKKLGKRGVVSVSLHPGVIYTALGAHLQMDDYGEFAQIDRTLGYRSFWDQPMAFKSHSQGVATHTFAAFHPGLDSPELNGSHLTDSKVVDPRTIQSFARDEIDADRLWEVSETLVGQTFKY